jgi:hypothetical protein
MLDISELTHTGLPSAQLQQVSLVDPTDPKAAYSDEVKE